MRFLIAGNWKMHGLAVQLSEIETIAASVQATAPNADVLLCVPATLRSRAVLLDAASRSEVRTVAPGSPVRSQEMSVPRC